MQWLAISLLAIAIYPIVAYHDEIAEEWQEMIIREAVADAELYEANEFLEEFDQGCNYYANLVANESYKYEINITKENSEKVAAIMLEESNWNDKMLNRARQFDISGMNANMQRMFKIMMMNTSPKDEAVKKRLEKYSNELVNTYSSAKVCRHSKCYSGETDLVKMYSNTSTDYETLLWAWKAWRKATGAKMRKTYQKMVELLNIGAQDNGFQDMSIPWMLREMDDPKLNETALKLWTQVKPFYEQLHAYVRFKLLQRYPGKLENDGPIPEHLLGNVWGQEWASLFPIVKPYPEQSSADVTKEMKRQSYTVNRIFRTAESFFTSLGMPKMTKAFWERSLFVDPKDGRVVQCHPSAADMFDKAGVDFRIKMCTDISEYYLTTAHHEMGHVEYYMLYNHQPCVYRTGANAAFHEAVGDTIQLSAMTPQHLNKIGLATDEDIDGGAEVQYKKGINFLLRMALNKVAFLPYGIMIDLWRWGVFNGATPPSRYNHDWWKLRIGLGGVMPPVDRSEKDFDPAAKYHVASNTRYIRYFFSFMLQFQFHRSLCQVKGHQGPYHECDIYGSKEAGKALSSMLRLGKSLPWPDALERLTGQREVDAGAILDYFKPLHRWLIQENKRNGVRVGWKTENIGVNW